MNDLNINLPPFDHTSHNDKERVRLQVLGISYSQIQSGAYALILAEVDGPMRLPVVVGGMEAQSIAIKIEGIIPPRPMTHDLFVSLMHAYGLQLMDVFIYKFEDGIFSSELTFIDASGKEVHLDARTSDAIAVAMRCNAPVYTTRAILDENAFTLETNNFEEVFSDADEQLETKKASDHLDDLREALKQAIANEEYEEAASIQKKISDLENRLNDKGENKSETE